MIDPKLRGLVTALMADLGDETAWLSYVGMQVTGSPPEGWVDDDHRRFEIAMHDLGAGFRRVEALHADVQGAWWRIRRHPRGRQLDVGS